MINIYCHALYKIVSVPKYGEKSTLNRKEFYGNKFIVESYICVYIYIHKCKEIKNWKIQKILIIQSAWILNFLQFSQQLINLSNKDLSKKCFKKHIYKIHNHENFNALICLRLYIVSQKQIRNSPSPPKKS